MSRQDDVVIEIHELVKHYGSVVAVDDISLEVFQGEIFALLGPNGAGKTTTVEILEGLRKPTNGDAWVLGYDIKSNFGLREIKKLIGVLPQEFSTHANLTVIENIKFWGKMYDEMIDPNELIALVKLEEKRNERYKNLARGQKQRVGLAITLVNNPKLIILDEPTSGLDLRARKEVWSIIEGLRKKGKTILLTTYDMLEAQALADRVAIIHKGRIKDIGPPNELIDRYGTETKVIVRCPHSEAKAAALKALSAKEPTENAEGDIVISCNVTDLLEILELLRKSNVKYSDIITQPPTLDDVFLALTGEMLVSE